MFSPQQVQAWLLIPLRVASPGKRIVFLYVRIQNLFMSVLRRLFTSEARVRILDLFMTSPDDLHVREVARRTGLNLNGVRRELENLETAGLLTSTRKGNLRLYTADHNSPIHEELKRIVLKTTVSATHSKRNCPRRERSRPPSSTEATHEETKHLEAISTCSSSATSTRQEQHPSSRSWRSNSHARSTTPSSHHTSSRRGRLNTTRS